MLPPEAMLMFVGHRGYTDLSDLHYHLRPCEVQVHAATEDHVWVNGLTAARVSVDVHGPCRCPWSMLQPESSLMSMVWAVFEVLV